MQFGSDNHTGASQPVLDALVAANGGHTHGYGDDNWTVRAVQSLSEVFETDVEVFFVPTGTAANCLALSTMVQPWQLVWAHAQSHIVTDESTAPEFFTGGARVSAVPGSGDKLLANDLAEALRLVPTDLPHNPQPGALSIAQATECGLVYTAAEVSALSSLAKSRDMFVHMDGARFANALVSGIAGGATPAALTWRAGVDILTLGASKNGCLAAEAIVVFNKHLAVGLEHRRKRSGHLVSKGRLFGAQILGWLANDHWLANARNANAQAATLSTRLAAIDGVTIVWPTQANEVFAVVPRRPAEQLLAEGAEFYEWYANALPAHLTLQPDQMFIRLVCSFSTNTSEVDEFCDRLRAGLVDASPQG